MCEWTFQTYFYHIIQKSLIQFKSSENLSPHIESYKPKGLHEFDCMSPRFALVCVGSEASSRKLMELLSKRELHGQNPIVTPCNKQSLSQFEMQSRKSK